jgi:monofunctional biosynthetic peptidoglycan transglycosylase
VIARVGRAIRLLFLAAAAVAAVWGVATWLTWPDVAGLAERNPTTTAFIDRYREVERDAGHDVRVTLTWVPYDRISSGLKRAVISGEDLEFFFHHGFSEREMWAAFKEAAEGGRARGASTITQQLAKNLWLSPSKNPLRKVKEALLTRGLERHLGKSRILEIYLNVVEFGPGIYGVDAASRHYFGKPASDLTEHEGAELAASLPRPSDWHPGVASTYYASYVAEIERRMMRAAFLARYVGGGPAIARVDSAVVPDSALQRLLDSLATQIKIDTVTDTLVARDTANTAPSRDSLVRDSVRRDSLWRDSLRRDSLRRDSLRKDTIH